MNNADLASLSTSSLFRDVDVVSLSALLKTTPYSVKTWEEGSVILETGTLYDGLRFVLEGAVNAEMRSPSGRAVAIETIKAPDAIATGVLFSRTRRLPVTVVAGKRSRILTLPEETVLYLLQKDRTLLKNFLADIGSKLELFSEKFRLLQFSTLRQKIASWIMARSREHGDSAEIRLPFTKERLADVLAVARPSLSRELISMEADGMITQDGKKITIQDRASLESVLEEESQ